MPKIATKSQTELREISRRPLLPIQKQHVLKTIRDSFLPFRAVYNSMAAWKNIQLSISIHIQVGKAAQGFIAGTLDAGLDNLKVSAVQNSVTI